MQHASARTQRNDPPSPPTAIDLLSAKIPSLRADKVHFLTNNFSLTPRQARAVAVLALGVGRKVVQDGGFNYVMPELRLEYITTARQAHLLKPRLQADIARFAGEVCCGEVAQLFQEVQLALIRATNAPFFRAHLLVSNIPHDCREFHVDENPLASRFDSRYQDHLGYSLALNDSGIEIRLPGGRISRTRACSVTAFKESLVYHRSPRTHGWRVAFLGDEMPKLDRKAYLELLVDTRATNQESLKLFSK